MDAKYTKTITVLPSQVDVGGKLGVAATFDLFMDTATEAAEVLGYSKAQTFFKIVLPQVIKNILPFMTSVIVTLAATEIPSYISYEVFLSYIGMGMSDMSLGRLIYQAENAMLTPGWQFEFWSPVAVASIITIVLYVVGQNLGDASDPRTHM